MITVFGATGAQGGGVVRALLAEGKFKVRGITRSVEGNKAKQLASKGVEMVEASLDDRESMKKALAGSYGVFLVTNFWEGQDGERETAQGKAAVDVCLEVGVKHLIYSGLENFEKLHGIPVEHFDSKAKVEDYIQTKAGSMIWNSTRLPGYFNLILTFFRPTKQEDGSYLVNIPMEGKPIYQMDVEDLGGCVASLFNDPATYGGRILGLATEFMTMQQYCDVLNKVLAPKVFKVSSATTEQFAQAPFPGAKELAAMFKCYQLGVDKDIALTKKLNPKTKSWEEFVVKHKAEFESL